MLLRPLAKLLAIRFGAYESSRAALSTRFRVTSEIRSRPFIAFEAVVTDTPASEATSVRVAGRGVCTSKAYVTLDRSSQRGNRFRLPELGIGT